MFLLNFLQFMILLLKFIIHFTEIGIDFGLDLAIST